MTRATLAPHKAERYPRRVRPIYTVKPLPGGRAELEVIAPSGRRMMIYRGNRFTAERLAREFRQRIAELLKEKG